MIYIDEITSFLGTLGLGSLLGILIKSILDINLDQKKILFEARLKTYSKVTSRILNLFLDPDTVHLSEANRFVKTNQILSETFLLGSRKLHNLLDEYRLKLNIFHSELEKYAKKEKDYDDGKAKKLNSELKGLAEQIVNQMRRELFIKKIQQ